MAFLVRIPKSLKSPPRFSRYILAKLINDTSSSMLRSNYKIIDPYIKEYVGSSDHNYDSYSLLNYYIRTFTVSEDNDNILVGDNNNEYIVGSDKKLSEVIRLIEYGAGNIPPVPKLSSTINSIQVNLESIYKSWKLSYRE